MAPTSRHRLVRLTHTRTLVPVLELQTPAGRVTEIRLTESQLLDLIAAAAHTLALRRTAQQAKRETDDDIARWLGEGRDGDPRLPSEGRP
ncbi:hypothetical protein [Phycicoccus sp.]|uniref:hypothetical protein n=1 Tax=Phycicoccus sp. TaxID=1902410 RepID=UPI002B7C35C8|nr:hypothetical protein [Phycicoccus sp.]HMM95308.1 hypothetical protein [Phycicoccus sp.]